MRGQKKVYPEIINQPVQTLLNIPYLIYVITQVLQENMDLADEILFDLKSLLKDERRAGPGSRMIQRDMDEIDPDDPKRLLRIS